jgi:predicted amidohydrolase YtcJ
MCQSVAMTLFRNGTVWAGASWETIDALLVEDGLIAASGETAHALAAERPETVEVDLNGGFMMPSFGDGHAHPLLGGLFDARWLDEAVPD